MLRMTNTSVPKIMSSLYGHDTRVKKIVFIVRMQKFVMLVQSRVSVQAAKVGAIFFVHFIKNISTE
jgi:hypothetical protein